MTKAEDYIFVDWFNWI